MDNNRERIMKPPKPIIQFAVVNILLSEVKWSEVKWSRSVVSNSATPWAVAYQAPLSLGFSRQEY